MKWKPLSLEEQINWAMAHGSCDPECEGRCRVCPRDVLKECKELLFPRKEDSVRTVSD